MNRGAGVGAIALYLLTVPAGVFFWLTSPGWGYERSTAGVLAGVLAFAGVLLVPVVVRSKGQAGGPDDPLPARSGWGVLLAFLAAMVAVLAYFATRDD